MRLPILCFCFLILFVSCKKEESKLCYCTDENRGLLCRSYEYRNDVYSGSVLYSYTENRDIEREQFYNSNEHAYKYIDYTYSAKGLLIKELTVEENVDDTWINYEYYENDSLKAIKYYNNGLQDSHHFEYDEISGMKSIERLFDNEELTGFIQFYWNNKKIWKKNYFDSDTVMSHYSVYNYYDNNVIKLFHYSEEGSFFGYDLYKSNSRNDIEEVISYNVSRVVEWRKVYTYENEKILQLQVYDKDVLVSYQTFIYY